MNHDECPVLDASDDYHRQGYVNYGPPGHKQGRGTERAVLDVLGADVFRSDLPATGGTDDRLRWWNGRRN